ncbi:SDR family oxidoreductase [Rhodococcus sp. NPDC127530]|uniref:SDR family oxidoreductase n=1 Tax=Rhodococcus TaxID=1827 RepID=UPI00363AC9D7
MITVVTGGLRGIGTAIADAFEEEGHIVERGSSKRASLEDPKALRRWVEEIVETHGRVDVLVNNAGVLDEDVDVFGADPDEWWRTYEINVRGTFELSQAIGRHMIANGGGRIINLNSGRGMRAYETATAYPGTKAAVARLTGSLHLAGRDRGLFAFDLMPGVVKTDLAQSLAFNAGRTSWTPASAVADLALALASGDLDALSGHLIDAMVDTPSSLVARVKEGFGEHARTLGLLPWGYDGANRAEA